MCRSDPRVVFLDDDRIITVPQRAFHVFVGVPVIFPPGIIDEITKVIFFPRLKFERDLAKRHQDSFRGIPSLFRIFSIRHHLVKAD